ncbi:PREDICTED: uncharacterized protein LOC105360059 [Ceratosolen solmsi marchali]|uniref:Uncharacterized protein LOC105360059 n=1 Tax=Ceratosolen solmsi marchali TaxID=326594 RepID=A0AAJ6VLC1_9HYME|nr:PREDICTED: uncharacterized protein LOC105360059 [Ceratosolen solmsi marchali]
MLQVQTLLSEHMQQAWRQQKVGLREQEKRETVEGEKESIRGGSLYAAVTDGRKNSRHEPLITYCSVSPCSDGFNAWGLFPSTLPHHCDPYFSQIAVRHLLLYNMLILHTYFMSKMRVELVVKYGTSIK